VELRQYENHVCSEQDPLATFRRLQMGIFGFPQKGTGAKSVASVSFAMNIAGTTFEEHCVNISRVILD